MGSGLEPGARRIPAATLAVVAGILLVAALLVPGQVAAVPPGAGALYALLALWPMPEWLASPEALPLRLLVHATPLHALVSAVGLGVAGVLHERRFGPLRTLVAFGAGGVAGLAAAALLPGLVAFGASGGALALYGGLLLDLARRHASASLFGPLVAPLLLHGAIDATVPGDYSAVHAAGLVIGALLARLSDRPP